MGHVPKSFKINDEFGCQTNAECLAAANPSLRFVVGKARFPRGQWGDHAWCIAKDGTIVDPYFQRLFPGTWQKIQYKEDPTAFEGYYMESIADSIVDVLLEAPDLEKIQKHKQPFTPQEKAQIPTGLPQGDGATVIKGVVDGKTWYACYTHRAGVVRPTMAAVAKVYPKIAATA